MKSLYTSKIFILAAIFSGLSLNLLAQSSTTFSYTGAVQSYTVPAGVTLVGIDAVGAAGGAAYDMTTSQPNALGGRVQCTMTVTPGAVYYIYVGGKGQDWVGSGYAVGGFNGGANGGSAGSTYAAAGGGASDIRTLGLDTAFSSRLLVAGGAGGGGDFDAAGGPGGDTIGGSGLTPPPASALGACGGGVSGPACATGSVLGTFGQGGAPNAYSIGGGGGGWWGGNGGISDAGGGGGSSYTDPTLCTSVTHTQGYIGADGNGQVIITVLCQFPGAIVGSVPVCPGDSIPLTNPTGDAGGIWLSSNPAVASVDSFTGVVTGVVTGMDTITYFEVNPCGGTAALATTTITVNPLPGVITGSTIVCVGSNTTLSDAGGGSWVSSNPLIATVDPLSGVVTGVGAGTDTIMYTLPTGCTSAMTPVTVNPLPAPITGASMVCASGGTTTLGDASSPDGTWTSSDPTIATVDPATGIVTGVVAGAINISYAFSTGCAATLGFTVNPLPSAIAGGTSVCVGSNLSLSDATGGGAWSTSDPTLATIDAVSGVANGVAPGTPIITYTLLTGCITTMPLAVNPLPNIDTVTGGGNYCFGGAGLHIGVNTSDVGVGYQLYMDGSIFSTSPVTGSGAALDMGVFTGAGYYNVLATVGATGCSAFMYGVPTIGITPLVYPSVRIFPSRENPICAGTTIRFTSGYLEGGSTPGFQWSVNGANVGGDSSTYSYTPTDGNIVVLKLISSAACATPDTVMDTVVMNVFPNGTPTINISSTPGDTVCQGTAVTFAAATTFSGAAPTYKWIKNTLTVSAASSYSYTPANGDNVYCIMNSNYLCRLATTAYSDAIFMSVEMPIVPSLTIAAYPGTIIGSGQNDTLVATATDAGPSPKYQWYVNNVAVPLATSNTFIRSSYADRDSVTCQVTRRDACALSSVNSVVIRVHTVGVQEVSSGIADLTLTPNPNKGTFTVKGSLSLSDDQEVAMEITNMLGQVVYTNKVMAPNGQLNAQVTTNNVLPAGIYILKLNSGSGTSTFRFVAE